jgi:hypothetical protein
MDINFTGMLVLLLFMTAGPLLISLGVLAFIISRSFKKNFSLIMLLALLVFIPLHMFILFITNPGIPITFDEIKQTFLISSIYVIPVLIIIIIVNRKIFYKS